jgi:hypothetical protein
VTERNIPFVIYSGNDRGDGLRVIGVHSQEANEHARANAIIQCVIAERQMSRHQQDGAEYAPRRTLHLVLIYPLGTFRTRH